MKLISVVGARPNFMKVAPIHKVIKENYSGKIEHLLVHTGQHYDKKMSDVFFTDLGLPKPDYYLGIGGGSHAEQTGKIMIEFEKILLETKPDLVLVVGDVNSTIACSLTAKKLHIDVAHVEAGLRSFDRFMPEEINRLLTDAISDYLFVTEDSGLKNLQNEGVSPEKIFFTGNVMIDSLKYFIDKSTGKIDTGKFGVKKGEYILVTMHRPSNVDSEVNLPKIVKLLNSISVNHKVLFPIHPRTSKNLEAFGLNNHLSKNIILSEPIGYLEFINLIKDARLIITDSGGIQEESTWLGVQCITTRTSTERPVTVDLGTNQLVGDDFDLAEIKALDVLNGKIKQGSIPPLWDGKAAERIVEILYSKYH